MSCLPIFFSLLLPVSLSAQFKIDLDSTTGGSISTEAGWTSLNATNVNNSVTVNGVAFRLFSADGSRVRTSGGNTIPNNLTGDFVFDDGAGQAVGLLFGGAGDIPAGEWSVKIWIWDALTNVGNCIVGYRTNTSETIVGTAVTPDPVNPAITFTFTSDGVSAYDVFVRENNSGNNSRLNAVELRPAAGPSDLTLSKQTIANSIPIGSTVGTFSTTDPTPGDSFTYSLASGVGSDDNGSFEISGSQLLVDRDLTSSNGPLSIRIRTTDNGGDSFEKVLAITLIPDSDADGLIDHWELAYFPSLSTATGSGNNDGDALNNLEEQARGTDPTLSDTDNDGFNDALEISRNTDPNDANNFPPGLLPIRLNEVLSRNDTGLRDGFNNREDWIELYNPNTSSVSLSGYHLTDDPAVLNKWTFPNVSIAADGYLIVFASGLDTTDPDSNPHTNFGISADGEYLALVRADGLTVESSFTPTLPEQFTDISHGLEPGSGAPRYFETPTPGAANSSTSYPGVVKDTSFTVDRGFYSAPFNLILQSGTTGATIRYTTDGVCFWREGFEAAFGTEGGDQVVQVIRRTLKERGIHDSWSTLREKLNQQHRITATFKQRDGRTLHVRQATRPEEELGEIYRALGLSPTPGGLQRMTI